jgi:hypothetical protein
MLAYWLFFLVFAIGALWFGLNTSPVPSTAPAAAANADPAGAKPVIAGNRLLFWAAAGATLMIGLRFEVGTDWPNYLRIFRRIAHKDFLSALSVTDPAYSAVNWLANAAGVGFWLVNLVCGALLMFGVVRFAKLQPNPWLAIAVSVPYLLVVVGMGYTRQAVAIGLCMAGLASASRGNVGRFVLWVLAGALFHRTAVVLLPVVAIAYSRNRFQAIVIGMVGCVIGYYVLTRAEGLDMLTQRYIARVYESQGTGIRLAMNVPPALIYLALHRRFADNEAEHHLWRLFAVIALLSFAAWLYVESTTALDRLAIYIIPLQLFVLSRIPRAFAAAGKQSGIVVLAVLLYSAAIQFVWLNYAAHATDWMPYNIYPIRW